MTARDWRESAKPKWVVEEAEKEMAELKRAASLRWPLEAKPEPLPFQWGGHDKLTGEAVEGTYYMFHIPNYSWDRLYITELSIRKKDKTALSRYQFSVDGREFKDGAERGPLYRSRRDAAVAAAWEMCEIASKQLQLGWDAIRKETANADPV